MPVNAGAARAVAVDNVAAWIYIYIYNDVRVEACVCVCVGERERVGKECMQDTFGEICCARRSGTKVGKTFVFCDIPEMPKPGTIRCKGDPW
jgi:hypothetical protein